MLAHIIGPCVIYLYQCMQRTPSLEVRPSANYRTVLVRSVAIYWSASVLVGGGSGTRGGTSVEPIICAAQGSRKQAVKYGWPTVCALLAAFTLLVRTTVVRACVCLAPPVHGHGQSIYPRACAGRRRGRRRPCAVALMMLCSCSRTHSHSRTRSN